MAHLAPARRGVAIVFFVYGSVLATWVSRIPLIKQELGLDTAELSLALLGSLDIAMNTQGVAVEREYARPVTSGIHGMYSVGVLIGAAAGGLAAHADVDPLLHFGVAAAGLAA